MRSYVAAGFVFIAVEEPEVEVAGRLYTACTAYSAACALAVCIVLAQS